MKRVLGLASMVAALAVAATWVGTALGSSTAFKASYRGTVTEKVSGSTVLAAPRGRGTGTLIGKGTLIGQVTATTANPPCTPLKGPGTLTGAKGKLKITLLTTSRACAAGQDDQDNISFSGSAKITGGTGIFRRAKGTLRYSGHYDRATGAFNVRLLGTLKH